MTRFIIICQWFIVVVLLIMVFHFKDPLFLKIRPVEFISVITIAGILSSLVIRQIYRNRQQSIISWERYSLLLWLIVVVLIAVSKEAYFRFQQYQVLNSDVQQLRTLGKHLIVGYLQLEDVLPLVSRGAIGGIFITQRNVRGKSLVTIQQEIRTLQSIQHSLGLPPLLITTDQEGGSVSRLSPPLTALPALSTLIIPSHPIADIQAAVQHYGTIQGQELAQLGVNVNLSPVVDLKVDHDPKLTDLHSLISERAIAADPNLVTQVALTYSHSLEQAGVIPTLKHFPGLGSVPEDTHYFHAQLNTPIAILEQCDWLPFQQILNQSNALMMLSHVKLTQVDAQQPVSCSYAVVQQLIREQWQYEGILITDDFNMRPIYSSGIGSAAITALNAGVDLILLSYDGAQYYKVMYALLQTGQLDLSLLRKSEHRLTKLYSSLKQNFQPSRVGIAHHD